MSSCVEDYEVLYTIGTGSFGRCQKIIRKRDNKILVWKEINYGTMEKHDKQMLVTEVKILSELKHPNIVRYSNHIIDKAHTKLYIIMEHCEGGDLSSLIRRCIEERRYLEEDFILKILAQLTLALRECHKRSDSRGAVLHRDLKPANIFLDAKQNVKLGDFGLARILYHDTSFAETFAGTPCYMSPEQIAEISYNEKSDIWSLGCLIYELCALTRPFTGYNEKHLFEKIRVGRFRRIPYRYSEQLNTLLSKMLNLKANLRPSVEFILQNSLLRPVVAEEQRKVQSRPQRKPVEAGCPSPQKAKSSQTIALELRLREVRHREKALKEREERLEKMEQELCARERLSEAKLRRAQILLENYKLLKKKDDGDAIDKKVLGRLQKAAELKEDSSVLMHIKDKDCVALEVRYHMSCFRNYTRFLTRPTAKSTATQDEE